jgi:D-glycero-alpha-D-manno-heptose 1-phosphate guanylyltransferase
MLSHRSDLNGVQNDTPAILLVGGMGSRLKSVLPSTPKPLARIGDSSFLELLVLQVRAQGVRRLVMCTGHLAEQIEEEFGDGARWGMTIQYSKESRPMGTAGALKLAEQLISKRPDFLVMNGDSFVEMNIPEFIRFHRSSGGLASMVVCKVPDAARYGTVLVNDHNRVTGFKEKTGSRAPGLINAGAYVFNRDILQQIPDGPASLEKDVFPHLLDRGVYVSEQQGMFIDIGTPEDYARAQTLCASLRRAAEAEMHAGVSKTGDAR